jgi:hypothetical protein
MHASITNKEKALLSLSETAPSSLIVDAATIIPTCKKEYMEQYRTPIHYHSTKLGGAPDLAAQIMCTIPLPYCEVLLKVNPEYRVGFQGTQPAIPFIAVQCCWLKVPERLEVVVALMNSLNSWSSWSS